MECADLIVDLSPPTSNQAVSPDLSPSEYIHHPAMLSLIRQKSSLDIGPNTHRRCYLEPPVIDTDRTVEQYYNRIVGSVFKANLSVRIPGEGIVKMLCAGQDCKKALAALKEGHEKRILGLESEMITLRAENTRVSAENTTMRTEMTTLRTENTQMGTEITTLCKKLAVYDQARFKMFKANILVAFVKKVFVDLHLDFPGNLEEIKDTKKTKNAQAALSLSQRQLEVFFGEEGKKLGPQYYRVLQNITQYIGARNETAHETHIEFAALLHSETYREKGDYWKWANLFPYVYGERVDDIVSDLEAADKDELIGEEKWGPVGYAAGDKV